MKDLEVGQVLSLKIRFNNRGDVSTTKHPYLIVDIDNEWGLVEVVQLDSLAGKEYKAAYKSNKIVYCDNPTESVIDKNSYVQLDNTILLEYFDGLEKFRRQKDKLSHAKLKYVISEYKHYHAHNQISESKQVVMNEEEILRLNT